ncbi:TauD/TfdA family dioxygenase [Actinoplanes sp. NPDC048988]|uniref:TauD/TfdA family dioxygenase n=1 Tax=Actinoplanes sp. NPDC048988 TaxID=3363901 RepID=UPI0037122AA7
MAPTQRLNAGTINEIDIRRADGRPPVVTAPPLGALDDAVRWLSDAREPLRAELLRSGCTMIRGLPMTSAADFAQLRDVLLPRRAAYKEKATPRTDFGEGVFSSTDLPASQPIRLHNENSYTLDFPGALLFGCLVAPEQGGATTVGDMREALRLVPGDIRERFARHGWLLVRHYSELAGLPWQTSFGTDQPAEVEAYCRDNVIGADWLDDGTLRTQQRRAAIVTHPVTGDQVWFNHIAFWSRWSLEDTIREVLTDTYGPDRLPFDTYYGDGDALSPADTQALNAAYDAVTMRESWQPGDLLLVDNIRCAHGREAFQGARKILVGMGDPVQLADCRPVPPPATGPHRSEQ